MSTKTTIEKKSLARRIWRFCWKSAMWFFTITISWVILYKWIDPPTTYLHLTCDCPKGTKFHKEWIDGENISLNMKLAVVASEDNNFMKHGGIDWGAVEKAKKYNETIGKKKGRTRGASTISQQTAKNVFLWPGRTYVRKGLELYFTYLIEWIWGKDRVMEVYLNVIETGPCKFGVQAAAKDFFRTDASKLSKEEAAMIAGCLPNPVKYNIAKASNYLRKRQGQIVRLMNLIGDNYFERYKNADSREEKDQEDKKTKQLIESLREEDLPEKVEEEQTTITQPENIEENNTPIEENNYPSKEIKPDSIP